MTLAIKSLYFTLTKFVNADDKTKPTALLMCTLGTFKLQFFLGVVPRLLNSAFTYAQPFLIRAIIVHVGTPHNEWSLRVSSGLIGATVLVYLGNAISRAWYKHMSYQLVTMYRGALVGLIYKKTLHISPTAVKENAPVTLMSTDVDIVTGAGEELHDFWSSFVELPIGIYILYQQVGYPSLFILIPTFGTSLTPLI